jgi:hypothetical protein
MPGKAAAMTDHLSGGRRTVATVLGPIKIIPECKAQAVCVNGLRCWEAGRCLKVDTPNRGQRGA